MSQGGLNFDTEELKEQLRQITLQLHKMAPGAREKMTDELANAGETLDELHDKLNIDAIPEITLDALHDSLNVDSIPILPMVEMALVWWEHRWLVLACVIGLMLLFAFFGYKLYKSLTERERRRQEKLLAKQNKTNKKTK